MFSAPIILLLDEQIERLQKARDILATLVEPTAAPVRPAAVRPAAIRPVEVSPASVTARPVRVKRKHVPQEHPTVQAEPVVEAVPPAVKPVRPKVVRAKREPVSRALPPALAARALGGSIPNRPVVVLASALSKPERAPVPEHPPQAEDRTGTLDALVRELTERRVLPIGSMLS